MNVKLLLTGVLLGLTPALIKADNMWVDLKNKLAEAQQVAKPKAESWQEWLERLQRQVREASEQARQKLDQQRSAQPAESTATSRLSKLEQEIQEAVEKVKQERGAAGTAVEPSLWEKIKQTAQQAYDKVKEDERVREATQRAKEEVSKRAPAWYETLFGAQK